MQRAARRSSPIALVLFDAFDTLITPRIPPHAQYVDEARRLGLGQYICNGQSDDEAQRSIKDAFRDSFKETAKKHPLYGLSTGLPSSDQWWTLLIEGMLRRCGVPDDILTSSMPQLGPALLHRFASKQAYELVPGAMSTLEQLAALHKEYGRPPLALSMATNSDSRILLACKDLGLGDVMKLDISYDDSRTPTEVQAGDKQLGAPRQAQDVRRKAVGGPTLSYDVGYEKPNGRFFRAAVLRAFPMAFESREPHAMMRLGEACAQTLYVGDSLDEDYNGATNAGLQAAWLRRGSKDDVDASVRAIDDLHEVVKIVSESWQ